MGDTPAACRGRIPRCPGAILLVLLIGWITPGALQAQAGWVARASEALDRMASGHYLPELRVAFGSFTYGYTGLGSGFSRFVEETLTRAITGSWRVKLVARHAVQAMDVAYREAYQEYFQSAEADALLYGRFSYAPGGSAGGVVLHLELASLSTGELLGATDLRIPDAALPPGHVLEPPGLRQAESLRESLRELLVAAGGELVVRSVSDRGEQPVYRSGESLRVHVFVNRDAYLKVYHVDVHGKSQLIYPNRFHPDNRVKGGAFVRIPEAHDPFEFRLGPPFGTEFIKVVASTRQFAEVETAFRELGGSPREAVSRGLEVLGADGESAETLLAYTIVAN